MPALHTKLRGFSPGEAKAAGMDSGYWKDMNYC